MSDAKHNQSDQYRGWLYKWTNYIKGYQKRWFVLQNGLLSYYRNQAEMAHTCRGTLNLANAFIHIEDSCGLVISNGGTQSFHLRASSEVERQRWVTALELAKTKAINLISSDEEDGEEVQNQPDKNEIQNTLRTLSSKLEDLNTCNELIVKHGAALQRSLSEVEQLDNSADTAIKIKSINERATLFRITSTAMINACTDYLDMAQAQGKRWQRMLQHEHEHRLRLEEMVEEIAKQHSSLEKRARKSLAAVNLGKVEMSTDGGPCQSDEDDEEFYDAPEQNEDGTEIFKVALPPDGHNNDVDMEVHSDMDTDTSTDQDEPGLTAKVIQRKDKKSRHRKTPSQGSNRSFRDNEPGTPGASSKFGNIPKRKRRSVIREKPNYSINLWGIMKNCIGRDLSKIPMPVNFSEPLSMLQRLTEDFEYSECLDKAAKCDDSCEQLAYVAAFTVSSYSTTTHRSSKPFNPLLGETYECDRTDDMGWKAVAEQVSHHPPTAAQYTDGRGWTLWQEFTMSSKFRGKYLQIIPLGIAHLVFKKSGNHYTWRKVTSTVHNIIVGRLWIDHHGEMDIRNHRNGDTCHLKYSAYSYFSREPPRKVTGVINNAEGEAKWYVNGTWDEKIEGAPVSQCSDSSKGKPVFEATGPSKILWKRRMPPPGNEKMYYFTKLAIELNEPDEDVALTDCRFRPDQRCMEDGKWDEANQEKLRLEEKQRTTRRKREADSERAAAEGLSIEPYQPAWFTLETDSITGNPIHSFNKKYWDCKTKRDWSRCSDIY